MTERGELIRRIAVIGAGPAGCAAAIGLAEHGHEVLLFEHKEFPRTKVCGEYISPAATGELESLLNVKDLRRAGATTIDRFTLQFGARELVWQTPQSAWALSRRRLDTLLRDRAVSAGVRVIQPVKVKRVEYSDRGVEVVASDGESWSADAVVHADGSGRLDPAGPTPTIEGVVGHKCHLRLPPGTHDPRSVAMRSGSGAYVGTITVEEGLSTVALVAGRAHIARHLGDADAMLGALWAGYDPAWREGHWMSCGVARSGLIESGHGLSVRIGNAAGAVDPVGGEGIGLGLWAGVRIAELIGSEPSLERWTESREIFATEYRRRLRWRRVACRVGAEALTRPWLMRLTRPMFLAAPGLTFGAWYRLTGKPR